MLRLNADRTVDLTLEDGTVIVLRPPTIGEWRKIRDAYLGAEAANAAWADEYRQSVRDWEALPEDNRADPPRAPGAGDYVWGDANPFGRAFALVIDELSPTATAAVDADGLPMWCNDQALYVTLHEHWREIPIVRTNEPPADPPFDPVAAGLESAPSGPSKPLPRALHGHVTQAET